MEAFLKEIVEGNKYELLIDTKIFNKDIVLKAAYNFLDRGYFFFKLDKENNIILQFSKREESDENIDKIIGDFSDELLSVYLRDKLEKDNKDIREKIVGAAISNSLDTDNFMSENPENQIDFDKDIDEILKEIENDPELKIDEDEIEKILKEIEDEAENESKENNITLNVKAVGEVKDNFKK